MASPASPLESSPSENPNGGGRKRALHEEEGSSDFGSKKAKLGGWENLDLILSLQSKDTSLERKIALAFDFVTSESLNLNKTNHEPISISRLSSFLSNWIQPLLITSENKKPSNEQFDPCLDTKSWAILKSCLEQKKPSISISPNLLRPVARVTRHASVQSGGFSDGFLEQFFDCFSAVITSNSRAFYNAGVDLWINCAIELSNLIYKVFSKEGFGGFSSGNSRLEFSLSLLEHFSNFLRFYPNPKNVFRAFVDRLLDPLLKLLVLLRSREDCENGEEVLRSLKTVEGVLSNGLFHPAHITGFFNIKNLDLFGNGEEGVKGSYHNYLFQRFRGSKKDNNKAVVLAGFGYLFRLFLERAKIQKGGRINDIPEDEFKETKRPIFEAFMKFMQPLLLECKSFKGTPFSALGETELVEMHCLLKSINQIIVCSNQERIYVPTEDTTEASHFNYLREIYGVIVSVSEQIYRFWVSQYQSAGGSLKKILALVSRELFIAYGNFLEIEYRSFGDDMVGVWLMIFAFMAVNFSSEESKPRSLLIKEILNFSSQIINVFNELRQVSIPLFALLEAVKLYAEPHNSLTPISAFSIKSLHISPQDSITSLKTMLCSTSIQLSISNSIKSMPERQAGSFITELRTDLVSTLKWTADPSLDFDLKAEILGRVLSEMYTIFLDSLIVTSLNSALVGNSVEKLIGEIRPCFSYLISTEPETAVKNLNKNNENETLFICNLLGKNNNRWSFAVSWLMVFFFRLYASSRSLYRQSISLMPPDQARKSSELMGNSIATKFGTEWKNCSASINSGYFYWILNPSISLLDLIQSLSDDLLSKNYVGRFSLICSLVVMVFQRLNDLNREIRVLKYLQKGEKSGKRMRKQICSLEAEAVGITDFLLSNLNYPPCELNSNGNESFTVDIWGFICHNIDVWSLYASKEGLSKFFSFLLYYYRTLNTRGEEKVASGDSDALLRSISYELLGNILLYDEPVLAKNLLSTLCHVLRESIATVINSLSSNVDLNHLPDWSQTSLFMNARLKGRSNSVLYCTSGEESTDEKSVLPLTEALSNCKGMLDLLQNMPTAIFDAKISIRFTNYILHLERIVILIFIRNHEDIFMDKPCDLLPIFLSCRRALRHIITSSERWCIKSKHFSKISKILGDGDSLEWLLSSLQIISKENYSQSTTEMVFCLADHTSHIFLKFAEICSAHSLSKGEKIVKLWSNDTINGRDGSKPCLAWRCVENLAQTIENHIKTLSINKVGNKIGSCIDIISCLQGFLWGVVTTVQELDQNFSDLKMWCWSRIEGFIDNFENFVDICLYFLLSNGENLAIDLPDLHFEDNVMNFGEFMRKWVETKKGDEITKFCERVSVDRISLFKRLFTDENSEMKFTIRELFVACGAILKLRCMLSPSADNLRTTSMGKIGISVAILHEMADYPGFPNKFMFTCIEGILQFLRYVNNSGLNISKDVYSQLISSHLRVLGKCISLENKRAKLSIHDTGSNTKSLNPLNPTEISDQETNNNGSLTRFKSVIRVSLKKLIGDGKGIMGMELVQTIERALVGVEKGYHAVYNVNIGNNLWGCGNVSPSVAAGVELFYLVLESLSGKERALKKTVPSLVNSLFNIILHLQNANLFCIPKTPFCKGNSNPDAGAVVLMCIEVLTTVVGRHSCPMDPCHVSQCIHIPATIFRNFNRMRNKVAENGLSIDRRQMIDVYAACCKLICSALKHRIREVRLCVALLEDSTTALLTCLESDNNNNNNNNASNKCTRFAWELQEAIQCASFFRRIYEEIRQQKDVLANYSFYFLATYISIYSGYGPSEAGIKREVDEALRPGVYSLIDICTQSDLQQLHTLLGEGPRRSTLAALLHDYKIHFQYEGKI